jgi:hypothetical protein
LPLEKRQVCTGQFSPDIIDNKSCLIARKPKINPCAPRLSEIPRELWVLIATCLRDIEFNEVRIHTARPERSSSAPGKPAFASFQKLSR